VFSRRFEAWRWRIPWTACSCKITLSLPLRAPSPSHPLHSKNRQYKSLTQCRFRISRLVRHRMFFCSFFPSRSFSFFWLSHTDVSGCQSTEGGGLISTFAFLGSCTRRRKPTFGGDILPKWTARSKLPSPQFLHVCARKKPPLLC
jgi:hypothetical protein